MCGVDLHGRPRPRCSAGAVRSPRSGRNTFRGPFASLPAGVALLACLPGLAWTASAPLKPVDSPSIALGKASARLNVGWRFHAGDDRAWSDPRFDDSGWERVDLTAPAGSHDEDVGLSGYVSGWGGRGHRGMAGYGWYRLHLRITSPEASALAIAGPPAVDSAYQIFWNGRLLGGVGDFRRVSPRAFSIQPRIFPIVQTPSALDNGADLLAVRVWMGAWDLADPQGGGIRIAPTLGNASAIGAVYQAEWIETLRGYIVEVAEAAGFAALCVAVWLLAQFAADRHKYRWLYAALLLTGAYRLNQAFFFWGQFESLPMFEVISLGILYPLSLAAWTMGWAAVLGIRNTLWVRAFTVTTAVYVASALVRHAVLYDSIGSPVSTTLHVVTTCCRLFYLASTCCWLVKPLPFGSRDRWFLRLSILLVSIGQFAPELSQIGVRGIWFPFGTGVSRAQFAYAMFFVVAALFLGLRLRAIAKELR